MKKIFLAFLVVVISASIFSACSKKEGPGTPPPPPPPTWPSPSGDVVGKITTGYQGWFSCSGDGSPMATRWWHWSQNWDVAPSPSNNAIISWPDMSEYTQAYTTNFPNLNNGQPAKLFSSFNDQTVDVHFKWMQENEIDVAALQRFSPLGLEGPIRDAVTEKVKASAEKYSRKFYIMYDVSGWGTSMQATIKSDWLNKMKKYTSSSAYAKQNGKPVICIWGFGFTEPKHNFTLEACLDVINWFKNEQGCYVIGGVPTHWRQQNQDSRSGFMDVYKAFNMLSPWMVGRMSKAVESDNFYVNVNTPDLKFCKENGIDYQPCVMPGSLQDRHRAHGDFMWRQFYNMKRLKPQGIYISMFDEYNEGNQIAKTTPTQETVPAGSGILSLDEDGTPCSSDYYLRLTRDGGKMFKGTLPATVSRPTKPVE